MPKIQSIFDKTKTIAIVGLSDDPDRYSYHVASFLQSAGYKIVPVNPNIESVLGEDAYSSLTDVPREIKIDVVDIFRKSEFVVPIINEAIVRGNVHTIWMQEGVSNKQGCDLAEKHGMQTVMNMCMMKAHQSNNR